MDASDEGDVVLICVKRKKYAQDQESSAWKVFRNSLILRNLENYLSFQDLQALRLTCKDLNQDVLSETHFKQRAIVKITKERAAEFGKSKEKWLHFDIEADVGYPNPCGLHWFYPKLQDAKSIKLSNNVNPLRKNRHYSIF